MSFKRHVNGLTLNTTAESVYLKTPTVWQSDAVPSFTLNNVELKICCVLSLFCEIAFLCGPFGKLCLHEDSEYVAGKHCVVNAPSDLVRVYCGKNCCLLMAISTSSSAQFPNLERAKQIILCPSVLLVDGL